MDRQATLEAFDDQLRRNPQPVPGTQVERTDRIVRIVASDGGWSGVVWSDLGIDADAVIAAEAVRFEQTRGPWEWKHYSYDQPVDLPARLVAAGLAPDQPETVLVAEIADLALEEPPPVGVRLVPVVDAAGVEALVGVHDEVFGGDHAAVGRAVLSGLARRPSLIAAVLAQATGGRSHRGDWSSIQAPTSPASGAAGPSPRGGAAVSSGRWSPTEPHSLGSEDSGTSKWTPLRTAGRFCRGWASSKSPPRRPTKFRVHLRERVVVAAPTVTRRTAGRSLRAVTLVRESGTIVW